MKRGRFERKDNSLRVSKKFIEIIPEVSKKITFMFQQDYEDLVTLPHKDKHEMLLPHHPGYDLYCTVSRNLKIEAWYGNSMGIQKSNGERRQRRTRTTDQIVSLV